ncbi:helix-turn-helix domain-containing protein [Rhodococcoides yunnanense]|uniref:helix-turn-helix domain-containing protein n=1 Tax=Rhodococcoides yunnanense TaxID=278209 RepID=UPI000933A49B|nr:AraC family transcriptional regulator [Rhodococcus yunnanensis]
MSYPTKDVPVGRAVPLPFSMTTSTICRQDARFYGLHTHEEHNLLWGATGDLRAIVDGVRWLVPPTVGLWIPAGAVHEVTAGPSTEFFSTYFRPEVFPHPWAEAGFLAVSGVLREVILHLHRRAMPEAARLRAEQVVFDTLTPLDVVAIDIPMPEDARALVVAQALVANPADPRSLSEWAQTVGGSVRTLTRVFAQGTGMSFAQFRIHVRVRASMTYLAAGVPVAVVSRRVGYDAPSAFVAVFRRVTGRTPASYFAVAPDLADPAWSLTDSA